MNEDYHKYWYNQDKWKFEYILTVVRKPKFTEIKDISNHIDDVKEVKGDYDVVQEKKALMYENAVFIHEDDKRVRFILRDDLIDYNINLDSYYGKVNREDMESDKVKINGKYYPYDEDIIPELEHRDFNNVIDKISAFISETPVKEIKSKDRFLSRLSVKGNHVLKPYN